MTHADLSAILYKHDHDGLAKLGAPDDEYDGVADDILPQISDDITQELLGDIIHVVYCENFQHIYKRPVFDDVAFEIWGLLNS